MKYIIYFLLLLSHISVAQNSRYEKKLNKKELIEQADYYFFKENFDKALELYNVILENYPKNHYVQYHRYVAYQLTGGRESLLDSLKEYEANEGKTDKFYNYWLGRIHYERYEFEISEKHFQAFLDLKVYKTKEIENETQRRLKQAIRAKEFYLNPNEYEIVNLKEPINSKFDEKGSSLFSDFSEILFSSSRDHFATGEDKVTKHSIFHSVKTANRWISPIKQPNPGELNENATTIRVVNDEGKAYLFKEGRGLYTSEHKNDKWSYPMSYKSPLSDLNEKSNFFIDKNESVIYFSKKTSQGTTDIFMARYDTDNFAWGRPVSIPGLVNTARDEDYPFLSSDGKSLYFSSNHRNSIGGFDVFVSEWDNAKQRWGTPKNMGFPVNTIDDEISFQLNDDDISGYFSSNRLHGVGKFDIYYFHKNGKVVVNGKVFDKATNRPVPNVRIDLHPLNYEDETFRTFTIADGSYSKEVIAQEDFKIQVYANEELVLTERVLTEHGEHNKSFEKDFYIDVPAESTKKTDFNTLYDTRSERKYENLNMLGSKFRAGDKAMIRNIYFDIQSAHIKEESKRVINSIYVLLKENPNLRVEIGGHTDNTGTAEINKQLSFDRAIAVKEYLIESGIPSTQIESRGYGSTQPIASNDDEANGRELNRRIEVRVLN